MALSRRTSASSAARGAGLPGTTAPLAARPDRGRHRRAARGRTARHAGRGATMAAAGCCWRRAAPAGGCRCSAPRSPARRSISARPARGGPRRWCASASWRRCCARRGGSRAGSAPSASRDRRLGPVGARRRVDQRRAPALGLREAPAVVERRRLHEAGQAPERRPSAAPARPVRPRGRGCSPPAGSQSKLSSTTPASQPRL